MKCEIEKNAPYTATEKVSLFALLVWPMLFLLAMASLCGCATKTRNVEIDGMLTQAESATVAIGSVDIMAAPVGEESAIIKYDEDTAWLSPSTKTHMIKIQLTGSNCVAKADAIVEHICRAFVPATAIVNGVDVPMTNVVETVKD